jgi:lipid-A-disaccharide synthase-like uncharacterized protein
MQIEFKWSPEATFWAKMLGLIALSIVVRWVVEWFMAQSKKQSGWEDALQKERRKKHDD